MTIDIDKALAICEAATPGPWEFTAPDDMEYGYAFYDAEGECVTNEFANQRFIAAARTGWPSALEELREAKRNLKGRIRNHDLLVDDIHRMHSAEMDELLAERDALKAKLAAVLALLPTKHEHGGALIWPGPPAEIVEAVRSAATEEPR